MGGLLAGAWAALIYIGVPLGFIWIAVSIDQGPIGVAVAFGVFALLRWLAEWIDALFLARRRRMRKT